MNPKRKYKKEDPYFVAFHSFGGLCYKQASQKHPERPASAVTSILQYFNYALKSSR